MSKEKSLLDLRGGQFHMIERDDGEGVDALQNSATDGNVSIYAGNVAAACAAANAVMKPQLDRSDQEQKKRKLQMNRTNAQRNRDRKRIMLDLLQTDKAELTAKNDFLKAEKMQLLSCIDELKKIIHYSDPACNKARNRYDPVATQSKDHYNIPGKQPPSMQGSKIQNGIQTELVIAIWLQEQIFIQRLKQTELKEVPSSERKIISPTPPIGGMSLNSTRLCTQTPSFLPGVGEQSHLSRKVGATKYTSLSIFDGGSALSIPTNMLTFHREYGSQLSFTPDVQRAAWDRLQQPLLPPGQKRSVPPLGSPTPLLNHIIPMEKLEKAPEQSYVVPVTIASQTEAFSKSLRRLQTETN